MARLVLVYPCDANACLFELTDEPVVVGRGRDCAIVLHQTSLSRHHARVYPSWNAESVPVLPLTGLLTGHPSWGCWCITDLGSTNGCYVNDIPVCDAILRDGDVVKLGVALLRFELGPNALDDNDGGPGAPGRVARA